MKGEGLGPGSLQVHDVREGWLRGSRGQLGKEEETSSRGLLGLEESEGIGGVMELRKGLGERLRGPQEVMRESRLGEELRLRGRGLRYGGLREVQGLLSCPVAF
jgi:hypothetical protein